MYQKWLTEDKYWIFTKNKLDPEEVKLNETLFSLGNGYIGSRGVLVESHEDSYAGTYISGIYNSVKDDPAEIVNLPNPLNIEIHIDDELITGENMKVLEHTRQLDIKKALLYRKILFEFNTKAFVVETFRFFSMSDIHTGVFCITIEALNSDAKILVKRTIDGKQENEMRAENKPLRHFKITEKSVTQGMVYLESKTKDLKQTIGMALQMDTDFDDDDSRQVSGRNFAGTEVSFMAEKQNSYSFTSYFSVYTSREEKHVKRSCIKEIKSARKKGFNVVLRKHIRKWEKIWDNCDIEITGDKTFQLSVRFNAYQLIIASPQQDTDSSIPAKTLTGDWYKGHIFWDTEIYAFPFFNYTQPKVAKNLLMYRARRLSEARKGAKYQDYRGALWPWESAQSGADETPDTWVNFDGTKIPVYNKYREHHIAADVIYAVIQYYIISDDDEFMLDHGLRMVFSTARFIASRVDFNEERKQYEIKVVVGPNEFQENVDNNSYTNYMAGFVLRRAIKLLKEFSEKYPIKTARIVKTMKLRQKEIEQWKDISNNLVFLQDETGLIEEFEGYFKKKDVVIKEFDENAMPIWPKEVGYDEVDQTQLVKQADVILLLYLFSSEFTQEAKRVNFNYYTPRTTHKSSLSIPIYMILALDIGQIDKFSEFFTQVFDSDIKNVHGNSDQGIHAASLGGAWQVIANGFAGISIKDNVLHLKPRLPKTWEGLRFRIWFRKAHLEINLSKNQSQVTLLKTKSRKPERFSLKIEDKAFTLSDIQKTIVHKHNSKS
jgi:kojibiose phosphorylase